MQQDSVRSSTLVAYAASELRNGRGPERVRADLLSREIGVDTVDRVLNDAQAKNRRQGLRSGTKYLAIGLGCFALGAVITGASYSSAVQGRGGQYFITIGLFGFGVGYTVGGLIRVIGAAISGR